MPAAAGGHGAKEESIPKISTEANGIVLLDPVTTNLAYPSTNWVRLEVALMYKGTPDVALSESIHQDIMAYLRTVSLQQLEGPRGFQYLRDDIQERVDLRSEGRVSKVMFRTFVIE
jgi:flagellar FliL protein